MIYPNSCNLSRIDIFMLHQIRTLDQKVQMSKLCYCKYINKDLKTQNAELDLIASTMILYFVYHAFGHSSMFTLNDQNKYIVKQ